MLPLPITSAVQYVQVQNMPEYYNSDLPYVKVILNSSSEMELA